MLVSRISPRLKAVFYILAYILLGLSSGGGQTARAHDNRPPECHDFLLNDLTRTVIGLRRKGFHIELERDKISIEHRSRYPHAWARMLEPDLMMMGMYMRGPRGGRIKGFDGHVIFKFFLDYFGPRVKAVLGNWQEDSDNLKTFNELIRTKPLAEAALGTWTGRQAARHGFSNALILDMSGERGAYTRVTVEFQKPKR